MNDLTYCEECLGNFEDEKFDYRFDRPICLECGEDLPDPEDLGTDNHPDFSAISEATPTANKEQA